VGRTRGDREAQSTPFRRNPSALSELGLGAGIKAHSIIADRRDPSRAGGSDGLVPYDSAHFDGVATEGLVSSGHLCQGHAGVIREVGRLLAEHEAR
jgi:hypothetical protein